MTARFKSGDPVRVKAQDKPGHVRTPAYVRGKLGWVERVHGYLGSDPVSPAELRERAREQLRHYERVRIIEDRATGVSGGRGRKMGAMTVWT